MFPSIEKLGDSLTYFLFSDKIRHDLTNSLSVYAIYPETKSKPEKNIMIARNQCLKFTKNYWQFKKQKRKIHKNMRKSEKRFKKDFENISISFIRNIAEAQRKQSYLGATCSYIYDNPKVRDTYY